MKDIEKSFALSREAMMLMMERFRSDMDRGLSGRAGSLKMIPTFASMPTGREKGRFFAIDVGGTNFRVLRISLSGKGSVSRPLAMNFSLDSIRSSSSAGDLFLFLADGVKAFLNKYDISAGRELDFGFTFSFPVDQTGIASGRLIRWTKGFCVKGAVGRDVVEMMTSALRQKGIGNVRISALINDTVGTLAAGRYRYEDCDVGVIIGTGTNACYPEGDIINIEWGGFDKIAATSYDRQLDRESENPGEQKLEKMVSGMYLGELARLILSDRLRAAALSPRAKRLLSAKGAFRTEDMSAIEALRAAGMGLKASEAVIFRRACRVVSLRASRIAASCIAAIIKKIDPGLSRSHTVAVDGSVFEKHPVFAANMRRALHIIFAKKSALIKLKLVKDGSGCGAAIIAAAAK